MKVFNRGHFFKSTLLALFLFFPAHYANASLIGDTVYLNDQAYDYNGVPYLIEVAAIGPIASGSSDAVNTIYGNFDFGASSFTMSWDQISQWYDSGVFNGLVITDINYSPSSVITGFSISSETLYTDNTGSTTWNFDPSRITYTDNALYLDMRGTYGTGSTMTVNLEFSPVPLPAGVWLFASGLIFLVRFATKRSS